MNDGKELDEFAIRIRNATIDECARVCDALSDAKWNAYKQPGPSRADPAMESGSDAANECAHAIRWLKLREIAS